MDSEAREDEGAGGIRGPDDKDSSTRRDVRTRRKGQRRSAPSSASSEQQAHTTESQEDALSDTPVDGALWGPGQVVQDLYEVGEELGRGGMGVVHKVRHRTWNHWMAVKSPLPGALSGPGGKEQFVREAELWVNLPAHPNIVTCHYVRTIGEIPRIFAEFVDGGSLKDRIADGQLTNLEEMLDIAIQMAWGLALAHGEGLVHQDVKPGNVMLTSAGGAKVTDFGLVGARARAAGKGDSVSDGSGVSVSVRGATPAYASPEQMEGGRLTAKTDLWSWAVTVLDMFAGGVSCRYGELAGSVLEQHLGRGADGGLPAMPESLVALLRRCFAVQPEDRPSGFEEIAEELRGIYQETTGEAHPRDVPQKVQFLADGLNNRALSMLDLGREDEAEHLWQEALEADPTHPESTYNFGLRRWRNAEVDDMAVVHQLEEVCRVHEGEWLPQYLLALVHLERDDTESALAALKAIAAEEDAQREEVVWARKQARERSPGRHLLRTFEGHMDSVTSVCLSADGKHALSGSWDKTLKLWDVGTGKCLRTFKGHENWVETVCLSSDGKYALSGSKDRTLKLWEVGTGECLRTFEGLAGTSVCLSSDGKHALSGSKDRTLKLWDVATGQCVRTFVGKDSVLSVCLSVDGQWILSRSWDSLVLWSVSTGCRIRRLTGHGFRMCTSACLSSDGRYALAGSADDRLKLWDVTTGECLRTFVGKAPVLSVCLSSDGKYALSGSADKTLKLWDIATGKCLRTFEGHKEYVQSVCLSRDGEYALSGSLDESLKLWNLVEERGTVAAPWQLASLVTGEAASAQHSRFRALMAQGAAECELCDYRGAARLIKEARAIPGYEQTKEALDAWQELYRRLPRSDFRAGWWIRTFGGHKGWVHSVSLSSDGRRALSGSGDDTLKLWDVGTGACLRTFEGHMDRVHSVCLSTDGTYALSGSADKTLKLWDVATGRCLRTFEAHKATVNSVCLSSDGKHALSGSGDGTLKLWEIATGKCLRTFFAGHRRSVQSVSLSADSRLAVSSSSDNTVKLWRVASGRCLRTFKGIQAPDRAEFIGGIKSAVISSTGRWILSSCENWTLALWDVSTGACRFTVGGHDGPVSSVALSCDERYALSGSVDKTLKLWSLSTGQCLRTFEGHDSMVNAVCISMDGAYALSGSNDNTLKLWRLDWELQDTEPTEWNEGARPYIEAFLNAHTPPSRLLGWPKAPTWSEDDFKRLLHTLGCAGYGWLRPEGVRRKLEELSR